MFNFISHQLCNLKRSYTTHPLFNCVYLKSNTIPARVGHLCYWWSSTCPYLCWRIIHKLTNTISQYKPECLIQLAREKYWQKYIKFCVCNDSYIIMFSSAWLLFSIRVIWPFELITTSSTCTDTDRLHSILSVHEADLIICPESWNLKGVENSKDKKLTTKIKGNLNRS